MTLGVNGAFAINSTDFELQPTSFRWIKRDEEGFDGGGHPIYSAVRECEIKWNLISPNDLQQILNAYEAVSNTGTVAWDLPRYDGSSYTFKTYSGTTMQEPDTGEYFVGYITDVSLIITNVRT